MIDSFVSTTIPSHRQNWMSSDRNFAYDGNTFFGYLFPCPNRKSNEFSQRFIMDVLP